MKKITGKFLITTFLFTSIQFYLTPATAEGDCEGSGDLGYICGPKNAEDVLPLGGTKWLLTSGMNGAMFGTGDSGHIYLVDRENKTYEEFFPGARPGFSHDKATFAGCPGPMNPDNFSAHGLALQQQSADKYRLYITSHGEREAIEVFEVTTTSGKPVITWTGCVPLPEKMWANSVTILSDAGFLATKFMDPTAANAFADIFQGKMTGGVYEWHPGGEVELIPGTELSGANGIAVSPDNKKMYVAAFGGREIVQFDISRRPVGKKTSSVDVMPDNIRWGDDGLLYTAGNNQVSPEECSSPPCEAGWSVFSIDPETLSIKKVTGVGGGTDIQGASSAVAVDNEIWIGTYNGDRIGYLPKP